MTSWCETRGLFIVGIKNGKNVPLGRCMYVFTAAFRRGLSKAENSILVRRLRLR